LDNVEVVFLFHIQVLFGQHDSVLFSVHSGSQSLEWLFEKAHSCRETRCNFKVSFNDLAVPIKLKSVHKCFPHNIVSSEFKQRFHAFSESDLLLGVLLESCK